MSFRRTRPKRFSLFFLGGDEFFSSFSFLNGAFEFTALCLNIFQKKAHTTRERILPNKKKQEKEKKTKDTKKTHTKISLFFVVFALCCIY